MTGDCKKYNKNTVGELFDFVLYKKIQMPPHENTYYVIKDAGGCKFTFPAFFYDAYHLKVGNAVTCRLDRINCNGELFFEPLHPYYRENKTYSFLVESHKKVVNALGLQENIIRVRDIHHEEQTIHFAHGITSRDNQIKANVMQIKKGRLFLLSNAIAELLTPEKKVKFKVTGSAYIERFGKAFVVADEFNNLHALPKEPYKKFNLDQKPFFYGYIVKISTKGFFYIEPEHPIYPLHQVFNFTVVDVLHKDGLYYAFIQDAWGNLIKTEATTQCIKKLNNIKCKVIHFKKGIPIVKVV